MRQRGPFPGPVLTLCWPAGRAAHPVCLARQGARAEMGLQVNRDEHGVPVAPSAGRALRAVLVEADARNAAALDLVLPVDVALTILTTPNLAAEQTATNKITFTMET